MYILANRDHAEVRHSLLYRALDLFDDRLAEEDRRDWNREVKDLFDRLAQEREERAEKAEQERMTDPRPMLGRAAYVGSYSDRLFGEVVVTDSHEGLRLRFGYQVCTLEHLGGDWFRCPWEARWRGETDIQFVLSSPGSIGGLRYGRATLQRVE